LVAELGLQVRQLPFRAHHFHAVAVHDGDAGAVVTAIFQFLQSADEDRHDVTWSDVSDDSTHDSFRMRPLKRLGALLLLVLVACGKRGDPHPPVPIIPKATTDLVVAQRGSKVLLAWAYPALTTAGKNLTNIRRVTVYRTIEPLPVVQPPEPDTTTTPQPIAAFAKVPPLSPAQFVTLRNKVE